MIKLLILSVALTLASSLTDSEWFVYKAKYQKKYEGEVDKLRRTIFEDNLKLIAEHNAQYAKGLKTYYLGINQFADMTTREFAKTMNGFLGIVGNNTIPKVVHDSKTLNALPASVDWRQKGYVTPVKNQGQCGSCWAFSSTGALEGANFKKTGRLVSLSEKNLMDCTWTYGNQGCSGGWPYQSFKYVIANKGIDAEASYPYSPVSSRTCLYNPASKGGTDVSYTRLPSGSEADLQQATATAGPISVCIDASHSSFQLYSGGVYYEPTCSSTQLDHAVLVVGYGTENNQDYWLVKNSWGATWGDYGYIKMSRNRSNNCGIASAAAYPSL